jgi:pimeloyl-ACP methyl ester carboxylesterase
MRRLLYLHGLGSGPSSRKGLAVEAAFAERFDVQRLELRVPTPETLRPEAMIDVVRAALEDGAIVAGSSLGGRIAAEVAARDPRVSRVLLLAPAFGLTERWRRRAPDEIARWEASGYIPMHDHMADRESRVDVGFFHAFEALDRAGAPDVRQPTLVMHGWHDATVPIEGSRAWVAGRDARLIELDDAHELTDSIPRIVAEMETFLRDAR